MSLSSEGIEKLNCYPTHTRMFLLMLMALVLGACVSKPVSIVSEEEVLDSETISATGVAAADKLLSQGESLRLSGDYAGAANQFERGIRMAPRSASLYLALAKTRLAMQDYRNAQQMAQRAVSLLPSKPKGAEQTTKAEAWLVVAQAKEKSGDKEGANRARENAQAVW
ncbi:hypothetical protein FT643_14260 [Ketobacter sp. MCCC 1A13808]|uniref:tetratricopeptide repeat protein n=1 Tax=Ketobacter sp. MCCC 1A13808 TaxID=2602738 RepID=UPI0012EBDCAC|nr:hypothetical protein [Ketobacter sp. MCCC 1A13808]MVF13302.1 hypothetical protein [Ketobacter sp. MCCC 1A13808]